MDDTTRDPATPTNTANKNRFKVQTVQADNVDLTDYDYPTDALSDHVIEFHSEPGSRYISCEDLDCDDNRSIGNTSLFSQITADLISVPGNALPWLSDPGQVLGSSLLLASQSYLDVYQEVFSQKSGKGSTIFDTVNEEDEDVFENSEYIDTLEGRLPLAEAARMIAKDSSRHDSLFAERHIRTVRIDCYKRLTTIGLAFLLLFSSSFSVRNAMNSLGEDSQLSLICYGGIFALMWFGGICANPLMGKMKPKWALVLSTSGFIIYPLSMFHMAYYITLPASLYAGFCIGLWWTVEGVYLMNTASTYSLVSKEPLIHVVTRFNGFVFCFFLCSNIFGNLLSSLLLGDFYSLPPSLDIDVQLASISDTNADVYGRFANETLNNITTQQQCGLAYYDSSETPVRKEHVHIGKQYIYYAVSTLLPILACLLIIICLRTLKVAKRPGTGSLFKTLIHVLRMLKDCRILLLLPLIFGMGHMTSLIIANYGAGFISCAYGVDKLGYVIMTAFAFSAIGAFVSGGLVRAVGRAPVIISSVIISLASAVTLLLWSPSNTAIHPVAFVIPCLWALSDGVLGTQVNSFVAVIFKNRIAQAMTVVVTFMGMGALFGTFGIAFGLYTLTVKVYISIGLTCVAGVCFFILEVLLKKKIL